MSWAGFEEPDDTPVPPDKWRVRPGEQYGEWTVVTEPRWRKRNVGPGVLQWAVFRCKCGQLSAQREYMVRTGRVKSCGCALSEACRKRRKYAYKDGLKECGWCRQFRPTSEFNARKATYDGLHLYCKECVYFRAVQNRYGLTREDYADLARSQDGKCAICQCSPDRLHVDHSHADSKLRGLLCAQCNTLLGLAKESPDVLHQAIRYLELHA